MRGQGADGGLTGKRCHLNHVTATQLPRNLQIFQLSHLLSPDQGKDVTFKIVVVEVQKILRRAGCAPNELCVFQKCSAYASQSSPFYVRALHILHDFHGKKTTNGAQNVHFQHLLRNVHSFSMPAAWDQHATQCIAGLATVGHQLHHKLRHQLLEICILPCQKSMFFRWRKKNNFLLPSPPATKLHSCHPALS